MHVPQGNVYVLVLLQTALSANIMETEMFVTAPWEGYP